MKGICTFAAWPLMWACYWLGHLASKSLVWRDTERWVAFWYPIYNRLMLWSSAIQDRFDLSGPWSGVIDYADPLKFPEIDPSLLPAKEQA